MANQLHETSPTQYIDANGTRYAYRRFGKAEKVPLVFLQYFAANMDNWDPKVINGFAADREVILFDNAGVASSGSKTPASVLEMTKHFVTFIKALGLKEIDLLGHSLGGMIAQQLALDHPELVRHIILVGTGPRGGEGMTFTELSIDEMRANPENTVLTAFFSPTETSQSAGRAFIQRLKARKEDRDPPVSLESTQAQLKALKEWGTIPNHDRYAYLKNIKHKILVVSGNNDVVVMPINSLILAQHLPNAQLIIYPDSSHGVQDQHAELFLQHARLFLNG